MGRVEALLALIAIIVICVFFARKFPKYSTWVTVGGIIAAAILYGSLSNL